MLTFRYWGVFLAVTIFGIPGILFAHCEVPCGIYDDRARVAMIAEHIGTIEKGMNEITRLGKEEPANTNQMVRWVMTKEAHADKIQHIISQYFLTQRVKPDQEKTSAMLALLHKMLVVAMKCKQTTDPEQPATLRRLLAEFETLYFGSSG